jgi:hypothetical protein
VESYEKKHNIRLHSFSFLPLFMLFFGKEVMPVAKAAEIGAVVSTAAGTAGAGAAAAAGAGASSAAGTSATSATAAATAGGIAAKASATSIVTKVIAGVLAATVAVGGGIAVFGGNGTHACKDVEPNGICDICGVDVHHGEDGNQHWDPTDDDIIYYVTLLDENNKPSETGSADISDLIPVKMKAKSGYHKGKWDATPPDEVEGNQSVVYTYSFKKDTTDIAETGDGIMMPVSMMCASGFGLIALLALGKRKKKETDSEQ